MYSTPVAIRLVGVRVDNLIEKDTMQLSLFDNKENKRQEKLDKVIDELKNKYGLKWEGSLTFEKVVRYLPYIRSAIQVPIYVIGIDV